MRARARERITVILDAGSGGLGERGRERGEREERGSERGERRVRETPVQQEHVRIRENRPRNTDGLLSSAWQVPATLAHVERLGSVHKNAREPAELRNFPCVAGRELTAAVPGSLGVDAEHQVLEHRSLEQHGLFRDVRVPGHF